ncbi:MAG TPA: ATP-binding protein [Bryobacteraceae bacterium]|nr:ATP-binding protein [Bryobacteraceae bacterium]
MRRARSIRFRLTVWYALILAAALGLFSALIWLSLRQRLLSEIERDLSDRAARFQSYVMEEATEVPEPNLKDEMLEFCQGLPSSDFLQLRGASGLEFHFPDRTPAAGRTRTIQRQFTIGGDSFRLEMGSSLRAIDHTLDLLEYLLFSLVPLVIAIACAGGAWLSRRALKPVDEITTAARMIGIDNLSLRLPSPHTGDELQRLTEAWNVMLARLEEAVKTLSQFAADASHELRTPLAVIRTSAELALRRARAPEAYRDSLKEIAEEAERMTQLVEDLLFLARHDAQSAEMPKEPVDLADLVSDVTQEIRGIADIRQVRIHKTPPDDRSGPMLISGNRPALHRLILLLLDNAVKYSRPGADVLAAVTAQQDEIAITIQDFGVGISQGDLPHIFKRFYQADCARTDGGFGLGLALAESIARAHDASIEVSSVEGSGSMFRVAFKTATSAAVGSRQEQIQDPLLSARQ